MFTKITGEQEEEIMEGSASGGIRDEDNRHL
jgi:hypothetical protein